MGYAAFPVHAEKNTEISSAEKIMSEEPQADDVASVTINGTTTGYADIANAFNAANGNTAAITIQQNCTLNQDVEINGGDITIYGQGYTVTSPSGTAITINGGIVGVHDFNYNSMHMLSVDKGTLNFYSGSASGIRCSGPDGTVNIYEGTFDAVNALWGGAIHWIPNSITIQESSLFMEPDSNHQLAAKVDQNRIVVGGNNITILPSWSSNNEDVVSVDAQGYLSAKSEGEAIITATAGDKTAACKVTVAKKDGSPLITEPSDLTAIYGQNLSDISLPTGWTWADEDTLVSVDKQTYTARFDTTSYENEYDFSSVEGYNKDGHYVERSLAVKVSKADTTLIITTDNMDKSYDRNAVSEPSFNKKGSTNNVVFTWYIKDGDSWTVLDKAPADAGSYKVVAAMESDGNYNGAAVEMTFEITKAVPSYTLPTDFTIKQGETLSSLELPDGFAWNDGTQTADKLGTQTFKATFTPEDTVNYQTVDVGITVEVVPAMFTINRAPEITAEDKTLIVGETFNALAGVTASDKEDGDLTDKIEVVENNIDVSKAGIYEVTYKVTDSQGASATKTITVTIGEKADVQTPNKDGNGQKDTADQKNNSQIAAETGDNTNLFMWLSVSLFSAVGMLFTVLFGRKKQQ